KGIEVTLVSGDAPDQSVQGVKIIVHKTLGPKSFSFSPDLLTILIGERPDLIHLHGLWTNGSIAAQIWRRRTNNPLVVSPHGMLDSWAWHHRALRKRLAGAAYEWRNLRSASYVHALTEAEAKSLRELGGVKNIVKIPNGVDFARDAQPAHGTE